MEIEIQLIKTSIAEKISAPPNIGCLGAWVEFRGVVRGEENGKKISALEYEAYPEMAEREIRRLLETLAAKHPYLGARVIHRIGVIPIGETAIYVGVAGRHRVEAIALLAEFMDRLKQDVPIWKRRGLPMEIPQKRMAVLHNSRGAILDLDEAREKIDLNCRPMPAIRVGLQDAFGRVLRETICAPEDLPANDRSTRDGYAILKNDQSENFQIVDTIHAADWKPRKLKPGETVRIATGATLPCDDLRVVMQENVERASDTIRILKKESAMNVRFRGEDVKAGQSLLQMGAKLNAGALALLATAGCTQPLASPHLRVAHFTTGDEIVSPEQTPRAGQIRDSNSTLLRSLLHPFQAELEQTHLPEDFESAWQQLDPNRLATMDLILISGGASVGDKDFTRPLLERLGYKIIFSQVNVRPGKPLIFGVKDGRVAFGLPGNPLSHFVCFHFAVTTALARMSGEDATKFLHGRLAAKLDDAVCPRETLWPARLEWNNGSPQLHPLAWMSSGDVTCLASANALIRVPVNHAALDLDVELDFLPASDMLRA